MKGSKNIDCINFCNNSVNNKLKKRKEIWFNQPFNSTVKTKVGIFLNLKDMCFSKYHIYYRILNRIILTLSYNCTDIMVQLIKIILAKY